jgi:HSP20 family protein
MTLYITPSRRISNLREVMDRIMDETAAEITPHEREMTLAVDVQANDDGYSVRALVPGMTAEDLNIEILNNTVAIRGEFTNDAQDEENAKYLACELPSGRFARVLTLPTALDTSKAEAVIKDGVLKLWVPKAEADKPKSIRVKVA